jgi:hypothetical protein
MSRQLARDLLLLTASALLFTMSPRGPLWVALALALPLTFAWGVLTLHFPARVETDETGIAFFGYGRAHRFAWSDVERVRVRRFLVRDRVFVRISPAPALAGRYWLVDTLPNFRAVLATLEDRAGPCVARSGGRPRAT